MTTIGSLFDPPPRMTDTSMSAYHSRDRSTDLMAVMRLIVAAPRTIDEVAAIMGKTPNAVCGRFDDAKKRGWIIKTLDRRKTRSGCKAIVWMATHAGEQAVKA